MNSSYKIALGAAIVLCGAMLCLYISSEPSHTTDETSQALPSSTGITPSVTPLLAPPVEPPVKPTIETPAKTIITDITPVAATPPPMPLIHDPQPEPASGPPTITLDGSTPPKPPEPAPVAAAPAALPIPPAPVSPVASPTLPKLQPYTILPGDTLVSIATKKFGHEKYWVDIAQANPLKDPTRLYPGDVIHLPHAIQVKQRSKLTVLRADGSQIHIVRGGETLSGISLKHYGTITHWRIIYNANRDKIGNDPNRFQAGTQLLIPRKPRIQR